MRKRPDKKHLKGNFKPGSIVDISSPYIFLWYENLGSGKMMWSVYESDESKDGFISVPQDVSSVVLPGSRQLPEGYDNRKIWFKKGDDYQGVKKEEPDGPLDLGKLVFRKKDTGFICDIIEGACFGKVSRWKNGRSSLVGVSYFSDMPENARDAKWKRFFSVPDGTQQIETQDYRSPIVSLDIKLIDSTYNVEVVGPYFDRKEHGYLIT